MRFLDFLFPPRADERIVRDVSADAFLELLSPRMVETTVPETIVLLPFSSPTVRAVIHEMKYHGSTDAREFLARVLAEYLRDMDEFGKSVLVPIPLSPARKKERGFNQVEVVVQRAAELTGRAVDTNILERVRDTVSQVSLPRDKRQENMRGAFRATHPATPGLTYVVIDDVTTTGATLQSAIDALKEAGAMHIVPIALTH